MLLVIDVEVTAPIDMAFPLTPARQLSAELSRSPSTPPS
jgi:hypothetical protein